jgi:LPPG:FO 2-phospho-L-lactate transferase
VTADRPVAVLCGGVGAARLLAGLVRVVAPEAVTAVVNTADDLVLHGLAISPDIDTVVYTVAGAIDPERGWGLRDESWRAMEALDRYGGETWFGLGDRDLGTHLYRTQRLAEGASPATVTAEIAAAWGLRLRVLPVSEQPLRTMVTLAGPSPAAGRAHDGPGGDRGGRDGGTAHQGDGLGGGGDAVRTAGGDPATAGDAGPEVGFQHYFVRLRHDVPVVSVRVAGAESARPSPGVVEAVAGAATVVIAPSNPLVSIAPVLAVPGVREAVAARRDDVVAVSPIVGGQALKGPADRLLRELGHEASVVGVARLYAPMAGTLVIDEVDAGRADEVRAVGMRCVVTDTIMRDPAAAAALAKVVLGR